MADHFSIHAPIASEHDYLTGRPGSFALAIEAIERARQLGRTCVVSSAVTRSNFRELPKLPALLKRIGVAGWLIEWVHGVEGAEHSFARGVPRFGMAMPWALAALERARRIDLPAWIRGAPLCTLGPFVSASLPDRPRHHPAVCDGCLVRASCVGIDEAYADRFGAGELDRRRANPSPAENEHIVRMFAGE